MDWEKKREEKLPKKFFESQGFPLYKWGEKQLKLREPINESINPLLIW